ncbi:16S rRNA (guanine527-N7)-methyltransferase [Sphingomicrobium lutaoense]|uniref:Ribosomal RNA small subunit methyltransferase G n=1 Tax=Sphingomicrobium lutaoense TaxID=515949 RepID=A0A839Z2C8_9SPHN|nr:16S rRNA (guanine(527)-N(7))-methyltransferase RsmG [Sphingomicrobium lutaoense]MBB3764790.1 16S rRNA (guanine527-N7)-methyltransferase [Sphingomicrobium lutaoense]
MARFEEMLVAENQQQNLVSPATLEHLFERHIVDGAQLVGLAARPDGHWFDIGTGPGLPGMVIAILTHGRVTLVEPRALRVDFLRRCVEALGLEDRVELVHGKAAAAKGRADIITARAVAALPKLLGLAEHLAGPETQWILPKGRSAKSELEQARDLWQGRFELVDSATDPEAQIILGSAVRRRGKR